MCVCNLFCNPLCHHNLEMRFPVRGEGCNIPGFNYCNRFLIVDVIQHLNQIGTNSIKFYLNSKTRTEFYFSFEFR
jgi:hypothetical protein